MNELILVVIAILWAGLYFVESAARKGTKLSKYAWLAYACRPVLLFCGLGLFIIFIGTDWKYPICELIAGLISILVGLVLGTRAVLRREEIEAKLKSGEIKPSGVE